MQSERERDLLYWLMRIFFDGVVWFWVFGITKERVGLCSYELRVCTSEKRERGIDSRNLLFLLVGSAFYDKVTRESCHTTSSRSVVGGTTTSGVAR